MNDNLIDILFGKGKEGIYKIGDVEIKLTTLQLKDREEIENVIKGMDVLAQTAPYRKAILARSIVSINGIPLISFKEIKSSIEENQKRNNMVDINIIKEEAISSLDSVLIDYIYENFYLDLVKRRRDEIEAQKKV